MTLIQININNHLNDFEAQARQVTQEKSLAIFNDSDYGQGERLVGKQQVLTPSQLKRQCERV